VSSPLLSPTNMGINSEGYHPDPEVGDVVPAMAKEKPKKRLRSLDAMRGMTVVMMILVDNTGNWFGDHLGRQDPHNNQTPEVWFGLGHSPWNQVSIADFVLNVTHVCKAQRQGKAVPKGDDKDGQDLRYRALDPRRQHV